MHVETDRSRDEYRPKYDERFRRKPYRYDDHPYQSPRVSFKSRPHHHHHHDHHEDPPMKRTGNSQSSRFDRQINDQANLNGGPTPTDSYYNSSSAIRERDLPGHYIDSERNRYQYTPEPFRRESPPPPPSSSSYRKEYHPYNETYRPNDYPNRYDVAQNRICSITTTPPSPVYQTSSTYTNRDQYTQSLPPMREIDYRTREDYGPMTTMNHHQTNRHYHSSPSYHDRSNFKRSRRPMRR